MKNIKIKKYLVFVMSIVLLSFPIEGNSVYTIYAEENQNDIVEISSEDELESVDDTTRMVVIKSEDIEAFDKEEINELLDDGISVFDIHNDGEQIGEYFGNIEVESSDALLGYQITRNGEDVNVIPIDAEIACAEDEKCEIKNEDYKQLINSVKLEDEDYLLLQKTQSDSLHIDEIPDEKTAYLQASNKIGNAYGEVSRTTYYYRKSKYNHDTAALKKGKKAESGWSKLGYSTVTLASYNAGGSGKKRYDAFWTIARVGALNGYGVSKFTVQSRLYNQNNCSLLDITNLKGGKEKKTTTIGASASGLSATFSAGYSYSYDPNELKIQNKNGDSELQPNWVCSKDIFDVEPNESYTIKPMVLVKSPKGKTKETKVSSRVKNLQFEGLYKAYKVTNSSGSEYVYLTVKNHKKVDSYE